LTPCFRPFIPGIVILRRRKKSKAEEARIFLTVEVYFGTAGFGRGRSGRGSMIFLAMIFPALISRATTE
jgi:hypothetical protein